MTYKTVVDERVDGLTQKQLTLKKVKSLLTSEELRKIHKEKRNKVRYNTFYLDSIEGFLEVHKRMTEDGVEDFEVSDNEVEWEVVERVDVIVEPCKYFQKLWKHQLTERGKELSERKQYEELKEKYKGCNNV